MCILLLIMHTVYSAVLHRFHKMQRKAKKQSKPAGDIEKAERLRAKV